MPVLIDQCSLVCAHLAFVGALKGCKEDPTSQNEDPTSQYEQVYSVVSCDSNFKY